MSEKRRARLRDVLQYGAAVLYLPKPGATWRQRLEQRPVFEKDGTISGRTIVTVPVEEEKVELYDD